MYIIIYIKQILNLREDTKMKRYTLEIRGRRGNTIATKIKRANQVGSLVGLARDMMEQDSKIKQIEIRDMLGNIVEIVK